MSALSIATFAMFSGLGLVALALVLMARRYTLPALVIGLSGLLPLTASAAWVVRAWPANNVQTESDMVEALRREIADLKAQTARKDADLEAERQKGAEAESERQALLKRANEQERRATELQRQADDLATQLEPRERESVAVSVKPVEPPRSSPEPTRLREGDAAYMQSLISKRIETPHYSVEPLGQRELVAGLNGHWYVLRLRLNGEPLVFPDRRFRLDPGDALRKTMEHLVHDILRPVARLADAHRVFVRGGADSRRVSGATEAPGTTELMVLPRSSESTWRDQPEVHRMTGVISNEDLPALRAEWLRSQISPLLPEGPTAVASILANSPGPDQERAAEIMLYIRWRGP